MAQKKNKNKKAKSKPTKKSKPLVGKKHASILLFIIIIAAIIFSGVLNSRVKSGSEAVSGIVADSSFSLVNQDGKPVTEKDFSGKKKIVFFGFTHCPDICPVSLSNVSIALDGLGKKADEFYPIFITVDPERDTSVVLKDYLKSFYKSFTALTGDRAEIERVEKNFRAFSEKVPLDDGAENYTMNHSTLIYVLDKNGHYLTHFNYSNSPDDMIASLKDLD